MDSMFGIANESLYWKSSELVAKGGTTPHERNHFFSPGCGGWIALHPKICKFAEMNPDIQFLQVNHEEHKSMCYSLHVHVLPFFRFYRGAHGRLCSFNCTNATIKKLRNALGKHNTDRCSLEPSKGLEEYELIALAANKNSNFNYVPKPETQQPVAKPALEKLEIDPPSPSPVGCGTFCSDWKPFVAN